MPYFITDKETSCNGWATVNGFTEASVTGAFPATATPVLNSAATSLNLAFLRAT